MLLLLAQAAHSSALQIQKDKRFTFRIRHCLFLINYYKFSERLVTPRDLPRPTHILPLCVDMRREDDLRARGKLAVPRA